ncbi:MAG: glycosyltransferase [Saprospiraceae bacterium]|nr:glycosyltransferase [Saprospiraceae bacterium]
MKVLFLIDSIGRGGKERRMIELLKGLKRTKNVECEVVAMSNEVFYPEIFDLGIPVTKIVRKFRKDPFQFVRLYRHCRDLKPDIIHSWGSMSSIYAIPAAKFLDIKLISGNIADAPAYAKGRTAKYWWTRLSFGFSDLVVGNSKAGLASYRASDSRSRCIYNGIDFNRFRKLESPDLVRTRYGIGEGKIVGMVGAFEMRKDFETFIKTGIKLLDIRSDISILAIGKGPLQKSCIAMVPERHRSKLIFTGIVDKVESLIQIFDIGVLCTNSKIHGEGISNAVLEYMALGKPVIATDGGGTPEIVIDGVTGFLVKPFDENELFEKINLLLDRPKRAKDMGVLGRRRVIEEFTAEKMIGQWIDAYKEISG